MIRQKEIILPQYSKGFHLITHIIKKEIESYTETGLLTVFIKHTSAGLTINENADPSVRTDLNLIMDNIVPEDQSFYTHVFEGSDDMPAHAKSTLTGCSVSIPVTDGKLNLGTWQGIYLCEFRNFGGRRKLVLTFFS